MTVAHSYIYAHAVYTNTKYNLKKSRRSVKLYISAQSLANAPVAPLLLTTLMKFMDQLLETKLILILFQT